MASPRTFLSSWGQGFRPAAGLLPGEGPGEIRVRRPKACPTKNGKARDGVPGFLLYEAREGEPHAHQMAESLETEFQGQD